MIFTKGSSGNTTNVTTNQMNRIAAFSKKYQNYFAQKEIAPSSGSADSSSSTKTPEIPKKKSMKWGEPTWFLFHTLAEKIKPDAFPQYKNELFEIIKKICSTLPCPDCAGHATAYMNKINFNTIYTKEDLQLMLWTFHNEVNARKNFPIFPFDSLSEKYSKAVTRNIIQNFINHHSDKHKSIRMISDDYYRSKIVATLKTWFIKNIDIFEE